METLSYEKVINATKQKIWDVIWNSETYAQWTQFFGHGSVIKSDWQVGGKTYFLNAEGEGLISTIDTLDKPDQIIFKHLGTVDKEGNEDTRSREVMEWSGFFEKYILIDFEGRTKLHVEVQIDKDRREDMDAGFIKGLDMIKSLAEGI